MDIIIFYPNLIMVVLTLSCFMVLFNVSSLTTQIGIVGPSQAHFFIYIHVHEGNAWHASLQTVC